MSLAVFVGLSRLAHLAAPFTYILILFTMGSTSVEIEGTDLTGSLA